MKLFSYPRIIISKKMINPILFFHYLKYISRKKRVSKFFSIFLFLGRALCKMIFLEESEAIKLITIAV